MWGWINSSWCPVPVGTYQVVKDPRRSYHSHWSSISASVDSRDLPYIAPHRCPLDFRQSLDTDLLLVLKHNSHIVTVYVQLQSNLSIKTTHKQEKSQTTNSIWLPVPTPWMRIIQSYAHPTNIYDIASPSGGDATEIKRGTNQVSCVLGKGKWKGVIYSRIVGAVIIRSKEGVTLISCACVTNHWH